MKKKYFVTTTGEILEYELVTSTSMAPQKGCDILVKNEYGHVFSANSSHYLDSVEEAAQRWVEKQLLYIEQAAARLSSDVAALRKLQSNVRSFISGENKNESN